MGVVLLFSCPKDYLVGGAIVDHVTITTFKVTGLITMLYRSMQVEWIHNQREERAMIKVKRINKLWICTIRGEICGVGFSCMTCLASGMKYYRAKYSMGIEVL